MFFMELDDHKAVLVQGKAVITWIKMEVSENGSLVITVENSLSDKSLDIVVPANLNHKQVLIG